MMAKRSRAPEVHKFAGASLADAEAVRQALDIIASRTAPTVIVVSALAGGTDALLLVAASALAGQRGDPAVPSGTLGFLLSKIGRGRPFSATLRQAMELGYTEPDPRDNAANAAGNVLRYALSVTPRKVSVGLQSVPKSHPLASLNGTDNQIVFTTKRYKENPLVITGPGAGPAVTAAGVLNDLLKLATS